MPESTTATAPANRRAAMRYENIYVWLIFIAALDIMLTWVVLYHGGREANVLAATILDHFGLPGMVVFKFALVLVVIAVCEAIGQRSALTGLTFARWAVALSCVPVVVGFTLLLTRQ